MHIPHFRKDKEQIDPKANTKEMAESSLSDTIPSDESIRSIMEKLVRQIDIKTVTTKEFIAMLSQEMGGKDLTEKKKYIKSTLTEILDAMDNEEDTEEEEDDEEVAPTTRRRSGLTMAKQISTELATFLGTSSMSMARTDVVRRIWDYIKEHQLQNPEDKREILLDDKMKALFQCDKVTIFTMNKYVSSHMEPFPAVNLSEMSENSKKKKAGKAERRAKQESNKKRKRKNLDEDGNEKPKRVVKHPPFRLSPELSSIVGTDILPRPQVTRLLWVYIKKHNLQNPEDRREILCDEQLKSIMGGNEKVTIFSMNKHITPHLVEAVDKATFNYTDILNGEQEEADTGDRKLGKITQDDDQEAEEDHDGNDDDDTDEEEE